jgi:hypothetical protein
VDRRENRWTKEQEGEVDDEDYDDGSPVQGGSREEDGEAEDESDGSRTPWGGCGTGGGVRPAARQQEGCDDEGEGDCTGAGELCW